MTADDKDVERMQRGTLAFEFGCVRISALDFRAGPPLIAGAGGPTHATLNRGNPALESTRFFRRLSRESPRPTVIGCLPSRFPSGPAPRLTPTKYQKLR